MWEGYEEPKVAFEDLRLDTLLSRLDRSVIQKIDEDVKLTHREHPNGKLILSNASKALWSPEEEHQLFAKGIVYDRDYNLVSLPLVKIYNKGEKAVGDALTTSLTLTEIPVKWDGSMIQIFRYEGEVIYSTRGEFETDPFCIWAREIMEAKYSEFEPEEGHTYVFELIHPENRIITDYGDLEDMVLLSVFDGEKYLPLSRLRSQYSEVLHVVENLLQGSLDEVEEQVRALDDTTEGVVLVFEDDTQVLHRTKVKAQHYIELFRLRYSCTYKNTKVVLLGDPELWDWDTFWQYTKDVNVFAEELEGFLHEYFERFMKWKAVVDARYAEGYKGAAKWQAEWKARTGQAMTRETVGDCCRTFVEEHGVQHLILSALRGNLHWDKLASRTEDVEVID